MADYKPGTVAAVTRSGSECLAFAYNSGRNVSWVDVTGSNFDTHSFETIRQLVVLDLHPLTAREFVTWLRKQSVTQQSTAAIVADQIEAQIGTLPPEPGLWAIVEATCEGLPRRRWVHHEEGRWVCDTAVFVYWDDLRDPVLIREGVE